jgi:hypothetical protein
VIVEKIEFDPFDPAGGDAFVAPVPPPPTVIGYVVAPQTLTSTHL